jgi:hypothetical protein
LRHKIEYQVPNVKVKQGENFVEKEEKFNGNKPLDLSWASNRESKTSIIRRTICESKGRFEA